VSASEFLLDKIRNARYMFLLWESIPTLTWRVREKFAAV
jgi:hypothetical protein